MAMQQDPEEDEEGCLQRDQGVVGEDRLPVHQVHRLSVPVRAASMEVLQKRGLQPKFLSVQVSQGIPKAKEGAEECHDADDPGDAEEEGSQSENCLGGR